MLKLQMEHIDFMTKSIEEMDEDIKNGIHCGNRNRDETVSKCRSLCVEKNKKRTIQSLEKLGYSVSLF